MSEPMALETLLRELTDFMPDWAVEMDSRSRGWLRHRDNDMGIHFMVDEPDSPKAKVRISGCYPRYELHGPVSYYRYDPLSYNSGRPRIGCSLRRGAEAIYKDMARRFIVGYVQLYQECQQKIADHVAGMEAEEDAIKRLAAALRVAPDLSRRNQRKPDVRMYADDFYLTAEPRYRGNEIDMKFHCPTELAVEIGQVIRDYLDRREDEDQSLE